MDVRPVLLGFCVATSFVNAVPSLAEFRPLETDRAPIDDDIMGSGRELPASARQAKPHLHPAVLTIRALRAILAARVALQQTDNELAARLMRALPNIRRDETVATIAAGDEVVLFNPAYVASLTPGQVLDHLVHIATELPSRERPASAQA